VSATVTSAGATVAAAAGGQSPDVAAEQVVEDMEAKLMLLEGLLSGEDVPELDSPDEAIDEALGMMEGLLKLLQHDLPTGDMDVQKLHLPPRSDPEKILQKYSVIAGAVVRIASQAISALPFGAPVAAVLEGMYGRAEQVRRVGDRLNTMYLIHMLAIADTDCDCN